MKTNKVLLYFVFAIMFSANVIASCTDGVQDGNESGIDCGPVCQVVCVDDNENCFNRVKDSTEEGIDCGGSCDANCCSFMEPFLFDDFEDELIDPFFMELGLDAEWNESSGILEERKISPYGLNQEKRLIHIKNPIQDFKAKVDFQILSAPEADTDMNAFIWWHTDVNENNGIQFGVNAYTGRAHARAILPSSTAKPFLNETPNDQFNGSRCIQHWCTLILEKKRDHYQMDIQFDDGTIQKNVVSGDIPAEWLEKELYIGLGTYHRSEVRFDNFIVNQDVLKTCYLKNPKSVPAMNSMFLLLLAGVLVFGGAIWLPEK